MKKFLICALCLLFAGAVFAQGAPEQDLIQAWENYKQALKQDYKVPVILTDIGEAELYNKEAAKMLLKLYDIDTILDFMGNFTINEKLIADCEAGRETCQDIFAENYKAVLKACPFCNEEQVSAFSPKVRRADLVYKRFKVANAGLDVIIEQAYYLMNKFMDDESIKLSKGLREMDINKVFRKNHGIAETLNKQLQQLLQNKTLNAPVVNGKSLAQQSAEKQIQKAFSNVRFDDMEDLQKETARIIALYGDGGSR